jgi:hypothetical protein
MSAKINKIVHIRISQAFITGMARALDLGGTLNKPQTILDDNAALQDDWITVGKDLKSAMERYEYAEQE